MESIEQMETSNVNTEELNNVSMSETNVLLDDDLEEKEFSYQDDTIVNEEKDNSKYTKIDNLDEDPIIPGQRYACVSFISPEGLKNCNTRGLKIRGVYGSIDEAKTACASLSKSDKYFDIFVCEVGKWCPWDPRPHQVEDVVHKNKTQNKLMKSLQNKEMENLNEIVGRKKEQLDESKISHKKRIAQSIKDGVKSLDDQKLDREKQNELEKEKEEKIARAQGRKKETVTTKNKISSRDRLGKLLAEREKTKQSDQNSEHVKDTYSESESIDVRQKKLQTEIENVNKKENDLNNLQKSVSNVDERLKNLQNFLKEKKKQKEQQKEQQKSA